jgi:hypothetical protein
MDEATVKQLLQLLASPSPKVRAQAAFLLKGYTLADGALFELRRLDAHKALLKLLQNQEQEVLVEALGALINLSVDAIVASYLLDQGLVKILSEAVINTPTERLAYLRLSLLSNLTRTEKGSMSFLQAGEKLQALWCMRLFTRFCQAPALPPLATGAPDMQLEADPFCPVGSCLVNGTQFAAGRAIIFAPKWKVLLLLRPYLRHPNHTRRYAALALYKNALLDGSAIDSALADLQLLPNLALSLVVPEATLNDEDKAGMWPSVLEACQSCKVPPERDPACRAVLFETLILLAAKLEGRAQMRSGKLYPIIREYHKLDGETLEQSVADLVGQLVECCVLAEGPDAPPPAAARLKLPALTHQPVATSQPAAVTKPPAKPAQEEPLDLEEIS